jgi:HAD superfamily hydrolase (TIGR01549 family)
MRLVQSPRLALSIGEGLNQSINMIQAVLFDLDNTLLLNDMQTFMPGYFGLLRQHVPPSFEPDSFIQDVLHCTRAMIADENTAVSNRDTFWAAMRERWAALRERTSDDSALLQAHFDGFYQEQFPQLQSLTQSHPQAADLIQTCFRAGLQVVIATNPVYPRRAVEHRLAWAGIPVTVFAYALVTDYENMHATKPHLAYYEEILAKINCPPQQVLMVGDSWENDIAPAGRLGLFTYWLNLNGEEPPEPELVTAYGSFDQLYALITSGWLQP